jgi:hypothetical protein
MQILLSKKVALTGDSGQKIFQRLASNNFVPGHWKNGQENTARHNKKKCFNQNMHTEKNLNVLA